MFTGTAATAPAGNDNEFLGTRWGASRCRLGRLAPVMRRLTLDALRYSANSYFRFILPSAQRLFIANDSRLLPSGVISPRFFLFVVLPLGLPMRFLPPCDKAEPKSAAMACPSRSRSSFKSETIFSRSKVRSLLLLVSVISLRR